MNGLKWGGGRGRAQFGQVGVQLQYGCGERLRSGGEKVWTGAELGVSSSLEVW